MTLRQSLEKLNYRTKPMLQDGGKTLKYEGKLYLVEKIIESGVVIKVTGVETFKGEPVVEGYTKVIIPWDEIV